MEILTLQLLFLISRYKRETLQLTTFRSLFCFESSKVFSQSFATKLRKFNPEVKHFKVESHFSISRPSKQNLKIQSFTEMSFIAVLKE